MQALRMNSSLGPRPPRRVKGEYLKVFSASRVLLLYSLAEFRIQ